MMHASFPSTTSATALVDRRAVMLEAWRYTHALGSAILRLHGVREAFRLELIRAWATMKRRATLMARGAYNLRAEADAIDAKRWLSAAETEQVRELRTMAAEAERIEAAEQEAAALVAKASLIASAERAVVTFTKANGDKRLMHVEPGELARRVSGKPSPAARTRKARHPHLMPVWDAEKAALRSINLATVNRVTIDGSDHVFSAASA
ncbi:hypothetical protein [Citreimonas salinaria]|uniref:Uncharacterized protein n=1 Tax=Citreimonas salinaria TaxID=321339 RepID=A0A1H3MHR2_9RHOB|nr:hypothetical protein [Citreimonas salinaria]SDY75884.1 hypothetical protein SAMN05444340_11720 [Citreimonas salinaria]